jgi:geranylgeranyl reductase family protein
VKRVAIVGGGPAGAVAAARIASAGLDALLIDEKLAWEKPCGGGITCKAYTKYPFLLDNPAPRRAVGATVLSSQRGGEVTLRLRHPLLVYSRYHLNGMLLRRAEAAGARIEQERVRALEQRGDGWAVKTRRGTLDADYVIVATGARNSLRRFGTEWSAQDTMVALGYYIPAAQPHIDIQFIPNFEGYIWVFPRPDHLSAGICGKGEPSWKMRQRLERFLAGRGIPLKDAKFFGHTIPALERPSFFRNRVGGEGWMAVGDAAGLVDPVTGEGLYYAIRSGDLAAEAVLNESHAPAERHSFYRSLLNTDMTAELAFGAALARRFFMQRFLFSTVPARMIGLMRRSPTMRDIVQDLFAGTQSYVDLKRRLLDNLNGTLMETFMGAMLGHRVVKEGR